MRKVARENPDDHLLTLLTVSRGATDEVERARVVKLEEGVAIVGEHVGVTGIAVVVVLLLHLHHRVLLVLEPCMYVVLENEEIYIIKGSDDEEKE